MTYPPGPPTHPSTPFGAIPPPPRNRQALTLVLGAIVVVLALVLAAGIVFVVKARKGDIYVPGLTLAAVNDPGIDPFTDPVLVAGAGNLPANVALTARAGAPDLGGRAVNGTEAGLYATGDTMACDTAALSNRLMADPAKAAAWASVFGINTASIPHYLNTLTPVVLTADTWVTNHTYTTGRAEPFQSVLQRGTSVYVDAAGVPRAMCSCGNPLAPPASAPLGGYRLEGQPWPGYQSREVTRIAYNNQNVTAVNRTTTIVPGAPTPVANANGGSVLQLLNFLTGEVLPQTLGGLLDLSGLPPLSEPLPSPASLNTPFTAGTDEDAERNGLLEAGNPVAAPAVEERAAEDNGLPVGAPASDSPADSPSGEPGSGVPGSAEVPASGAPESPASENPAAQSPPAAAAVPTSFSGAGDLIGSFVFDDAGLAVSCSVPAGAPSGTITLTCSDGVPRTVGATALQRAAVLGATDATGVWTLALSSRSVVVRSASWTVAQPEIPRSAPPAETSTETYEAPPPAETPTETPTTTEPTTSEYLPPPEEPTQAPESPAEVPYSSPAA
ncbi:DUF6777 domain-containing protein [Gordonia alkanivorans]|uniref:DUF6777 domain-containing protein n=1 Tax=Gordonia alkanivorans TaxID=84096 RepID=UPI0004AE4C0A|nr:DUF6777 domain-containing protein [Gordonia alkanivorans]MDH3013859.1 hypothetical protein [Gordonia alkanivorans]MDJ0029726.1 hypothetical protein [Gordonia alkanivorans]